MDSVMDLRKGVDVGCVVGSGKVVGGDGASWGGWRLEGRVLGCRRLEVEMGRQGEESWRLRLRDLGLRLGFSPRNRCGCKGAIVELKAQLVGIRDRVRSAVEGSAPAPSIAKTTGEGKRVVSASNPEAKDAADLLRMCLQCGVAKTYSHIRGMVCPICGDRPPADPLKEPEKKKGSTIKDKEKSKRMKGQSSHASWKSETEMQLRQQFD